MKRKRATIWPEDGLKAEIGLIGTCILYNADKCSIFGARYPCLDRNTYLLSLFSSSKPV